MQSSDDIDEDVFTSFSDSIALLVAGVVLTLVVSAAYLCAVAVIKTVTSPFARISKLHRAQRARADRDLVLLPFEQYCRNRPKELPAARRRAA